jgi:hypothetical protein
MDKKRVMSSVSFADSEYKSFHMTEEATLTVYMKSWEEEPFKIVFKHATQFLYRLGDVPKGLYELSNTSSFLEEALSKEYIEIPLDHPYKLFQIEDINDFPFIQVVAESVIVIKE